MAKTNYHTLLQADQQTLDLVQVKRMALGPSRPLRPFTVGYWTKSCKHIYKFLPKRPYLVRQRQQYVSGTSSSGTTSPRPFPLVYSSSGRKEGGGGTPAAAKSSGV